MPRIQQVTTIKLINLKGQYTIATGKQNIAKTM
jgi:hypothetical protein